MRAHLNALDPAIAACAHYLGAAREAIHTVTIEYQEFKDQRFAASVAAAETATAELAERLAGRMRLGAAMRESMRCIKLQNSDAPIR